MEELIKVTTNTEGNQVVSARELHLTLEVQKHFSQWIEPKLVRFTHGIDFLTLELESTGGRPSTDYVLTLDCAKMIAMLQNNEIGDKVRKYFLECEKRLLTPKELTKREILVLALEAEDRALMAEQKMLLAEVKSNQLEIELDKSKEWFTIKKVAFQNKVNWKSLNWKLLKNASEVLGYYPKKVFDANFPQGVNSYNYAAWKMVYPNFDYNFSATL